MSAAIERPKTYEEGLRDGFLKGQEEANKIMEQMLHAACNPVVCELPETEAVKLLQKENTELKSKVDALETDNYNANCNLALITGKLDKAIDLLRQCQSTYLRDPEFKIEVERFLKEIEK